MKYTIRIDAKEDELESASDSTLNRLLKFLNDTRYTACLVYREVSSEIQKLHYQGVIELDSKDVSWHKERWCRLFKDYPKGKKSSSIMKKDQYEVYITKDKDQVLNRGYTEEYIKDLESKSYTKEIKVKKDYYDRFWTYITEYDHKNEDWRYSSNYICLRLIDFWGLEKQDIKNFPFYRSLVYNIQARLLHNDTSKRGEKTKNELMLQIMMS